LSETTNTVSDNLSFNKSPQQPDKSSPPPHPYQQHRGRYFANSTNILPAKQGRIWYEADIIRQVDSLGGVKME